MSGMAENNDKGGHEHRSGLPLIIGQGPKVLILGTIPSEQSAQKGQYYGNPRNQFWTIVHAIFGDTPGPDYDARLNYLMDRRICLWDVFKECDIIDSKDSTIKNGVLNDLEGLLDENPGIGHVFLNGQKAARHYQEAVCGWTGQGHSRPMAVVLPSTSTAYPLTLNKKVEAWSIVRQVLEG